jgi:hypothetical protein
VNFFLLSQAFPGLLTKLLEKDFSNSIRSGFEATGLYPLSVGKALSKLPKENREVESEVQQQLINQLSDLRHNPPATTRAGRPKKNEKLPAGSSYTCHVVEEDEDDAEADSEESEDSEDTGEESDYQTRTKKVPASSVPKRVPVSKPVLVSKRARVFSDSSDSSGEEGTRRRADVRKILARLKQKKAKYARQFAQKNTEEPSESQDQPFQEAVDQPGREVIDQPAQETVDEPGPEAIDQPAQGAVTNYPPESYVVAVYQGDWYVGEVIAKEGEPEADLRDEYVLVSFMERTKGDLLKWPCRLDLLNVLKVR